MFKSFLRGLVLAQCLLETATVQAHVVITYPGWRGNNLGRNDEFPFGMQWMYPCGGLSVTTNRTHWPLDGGAVAFQPGWFTGHESSLVYINIGLGEQPDNYSWPITTFYLEGPTNNPYPGTVCLPMLTLPEVVRSRVKSGDLATIQIVQAAKHGAGLFSCADIIFTDDNSKVPDVNEGNCFNSSSIDISDVAILGSQELPSACSSLGLGSTPVFTTSEATTSGDRWSWACEDNARREALNMSFPSYCTSSALPGSTTGGTEESAAQGMRGMGGNGVSAAVSAIAAVMLLVGGL